MRIAQDYSVSSVILRKVSAKTIDKYVSAGLYKGKAGAYNIDDPEFSSFIKNVRGSYTNIMGLPKEKIPGLIKSVL
jgi:predicted house-cleaning NTP pyrophosphatase (Maf/HAM1 superfamily)